MYARLILLELIHNRLLIYVINSIFCDVKYLYFIQTRSHINYFGIQEMLEYWMSIVCLCWLHCFRAFDTHEMALDRHAGIFQTIRGRKEKRLYHFLAKNLQNH